MAFCRIFFKSGARNITFQFAVFTGTAERVPRVYYLVTRLKTERVVVYLATDNARPTDTGAYSEVGHNIKTLTRSLRRLAKRHQGRIIFNKNRRV